MNLTVYPPQKTNEICTTFLPDEVYYKRLSISKPSLIGTIVMVALFGVAGIFLVLPNELLDHAMYELCIVISIMMFVFAKGLIGHYRRTSAEVRAHDLQKLEHPEDVCIRDFPWDRTKASVNFEETARGRFRFAVYLGLMLLPFHYIIFRHIGFFTVETAFLLFFDLIPLVIAGAGALARNHHNVYGRSEFRYNLYPYFLGESVEGRWWVEKSIGEYDAIEFTLRCIQKRSEENDFESERVTRELYSQKFVLRQQIGHSSGLELPISIPLPKEKQFETHLNNPDPRYWELRIKLVGSWVPYDVGFLLPVYRRKPL